MDSFCYICLQEKEDLSTFMPKNIQGSFLVCEDCLEEDIPKWSLQEWEARPEEYLKRKNQSSSKKEEPKEEKKQEPTQQLQAAQHTEEEEEKELPGNMYIFLQQNVLRYSMKDRTWEGFQLTLDLNPTYIPPEEQISFSLLSTSAACAQIRGIEWADVVITGGILYPLFSFYGALNKDGDAVNLKSGPKLREPKYQHAMASSEQQVTKNVYTGGGLKTTENQKKEPSLKIEQLNLQKQNEWSVIGELKDTRISTAALVIKEVLYFFGGFTMSQDKQIPFIEALNLQTNDHKAIHISLAQEMAYPLAGFRTSRDPSASEKVLIFGGSEQNYAFNCVYSLNIKSNELEFIMYTYNCRADFAIGCQNQENVVLVGGAESGGKSEVVDVKHKTSTPLFDYESCMETIPTSQGVEFADLRWCCYFFK